MGHIPFSAENINQKQVVYNLYIFVFSGKPIWTDTTTFLVH